MKQGGNQSILDYISTQILISTKFFTSFFAPKCCITAIFLLYKFNMDQGMLFFKSKFRVYNNSTLT